MRQAMTNTNLKVVFQNIVISHIYIILKLFMLVKWLCTRESRLLGHKLTFLNVSKLGKMRKNVLKPEMSMVCRDSTLFDLSSANFTLEMVEKQDDQWKRRGGEGAK